MSSVNHPDHYGGESNPYEATKKARWHLDRAILNFEKEGFWE